MLVSIIALLAAGTPTPVCHRINAAGAVAHYAMLSGRSDARGVAAMYAADGVLVGPDGAPITGPVEVEKFLAGFGAYKLANYTMTIDATERVGGGWRTAGVFRQNGSDPAGAPFSAQGRFVIDWRCARQGWRIAHLATTPGT